MAHVIDPRGVDLGDITNRGLLDYYQREPGYTVGGVTTPANPARSNADILPVWAANTIYAAGQEILDPTGVTILVRQTTGTSRATYDATEQTQWSAATSTGGSSLTVQDENSNVSTAVTQIDFQGAGVTASAGTGEVVVTIPGGSGSALTPTAVKTANYTAVAGDLVPVDTTSASVTVTLPTAPADKSQIGVKHVIRGGTNTVTIAAGGSDVFNKTGGSTTATLTLVNQGTVLQYKASGAIWYVVSDDLPLSQLDARFPVVEPTTVPPLTNTTGSVLGTATTAAHADHTHAVGTHDHSTTAKGGQLTPSTGLAATGTPSASTVLFGNNTWGAVPGGTTVTITTQAADYTLALADAGTDVEGTKSTAQNVTVPPHSSVAFLTGTIINVRQAGAGQVTIVAGAGVTLRTPNGAKTAHQYSTLSLVQRAADEWIVAGDATT